MSNFEIRPGAGHEREPGCLFCEELLEQDEGVVADTPRWRILVSRDQGYLGRCMVIARSHTETVADMSFAQNDDLFDAQVRLEQAVRGAFGAGWCNWTQLGNDAFQAEHPMPHFHTHLRPRYQQPVKFAGYEFSDPDFGHMYDLNRRWNVDADPEAAGVKDRIAEAIWQHLPTTHGYT